MKKKTARSETTAMANPKPELEQLEQEEEDKDEGTILSPDSDVCQALTDRYSKSRAPQHRHLIATAAALRSILLEESLPLSPPAYFAAAITSFTESSAGDVDSTAALSALISILLSSEALALQPNKAKDAAFLLAEFLKGLSPDGKLATGTVRSLVKSLGSLALRVDSEDWSAVELPLRSLLAFSVDKRPKVRRCAQECVVKVFNTLQGSGVKKCASKIVLSLYPKYIPMMKEVNSTELSDTIRSKTPLNTKQMEVLHILHVMKVIVPYLTDKVKMKILSNVSKRLRCCFSLFTQHILGLIEILLENTKVEDLLSESENILSALASYVSSAERSSANTVIFASSLLRNALDKLRDAEPSLWIRFLPSIFTSVAGYLSSDATVSKQTEDLLEGLINTHIDLRLFLNIMDSPCVSGNEDTPQMIAVKSICSEFNKMLGACDVPSEYMTNVISVLFLKLGELSCFFMEEILLKLSQKAIDLEKDLPNLEHLEACIGSAIIAMGPQKVLLLIPVSLLPDKGTCSNTWMISTLKKYVIGASLQYFMEHIIPLAESVKNACKKVKKASLSKGLQSCFLGLWDLLPAFCRHPTDTAQNFEALSKMLMTVLKADPPLHEAVVKALQELVNGNRSVISGLKDAKKCIDCPTSFFSDKFTMETGSLLSHYSKETASRNMNALASGSMDLFQMLTDIFLTSPPEKRTSLKGAIGCLASVISTSSIMDFFVSLLEKCASINDLADSRSVEGQCQEGNIKEGKEQKAPNVGHEKLRCLVMELASSFVDTADKDLIHTVFNFVKSSLLANEGTCQNEAYCTLSKILKGHGWFLSAEIDQLVDLLFKIKIPVDRMILESRFACLHHLLVYIIKSNDEDMDTKAFLILNEIIVTLKTKKESRKSAYDILLKISCCLKDSQSTDGESDLKRLLNMVMGYLSGSSPHIVSGAIAALSLLIYNDATFCASVPNLIPSVLTLLQNKDTEVTKATLGFFKVLVSSLQCNDLINLLPDIVHGILPWSSISKYHFRSKVGIIFEILIRKCGIDAVDTIVPKKYKSFMRTVKEGRQSKKHPKDLSSSDVALNSTDSVKKRGQKRPREDALGTKEKGTLNNFQKGKRKKQNNSSTDRNSSQIRDKGKTESANNAVTSSSERPFGSQMKGRDMKRKRKPDEKQNGGKRTMRIQTEKDDRNKNVDHAKSSGSSRSKKPKRKFKNQSSKS